MKQLLLAPPRGDIAQKHRAFRFIFTTRHRGEWDRMMKETEMAHMVITSPGKIWEQTVEAREKKAHSLRWVARLLRLWRRACMVLAEWSSRALQHNELAQLNDHLLADIGLRREKQIVDASKLFC